VTAFWDHAPEEELENCDLFHWIVCGIDLPQRFSELFNRGDHCNTNLINRNALQSLLNAVHVLGADPLKLGDGLRIENDHGCCFSASRAA